MLVGGGEVWGGAWSIDELVLEGGRWEDRLLV